MEWFIPLEAESWTIYFSKIKDFLSELKELGKFPEEIESKDEEVFAIIPNIGFTVTVTLWAAWQV